MAPPALYIEAVEKMLSPILVDSRGFLVEGQIEAEQRMDDTHFEPQSYSQCSVTLAYQ